MEKFRRRKVTAIVARNPNNLLLTTPLEENQRIGKYNGSPLLGSDPGSRSCGTSSDIELLQFDRGKISSRLPPGTPMKKLLADEMSKEIESKRRSPGVIARLMGLDGPPQQNYNKPRKKNSEDCQQDAFSGRFHQSSKHYDSLSHRKSSKGHQKFKDVYEVVACSNEETRNCLSHAASNWNPCEDDIAFIRQKFMEAKRFSTDEKLQNSQEFHDAIEVLYSNKDILLKFLEEPDSLFLKHLFEVCDTPESHWKHALKMESSNVKCSIDAFGQPSGREGYSNNDINHFHKHRERCNGYLYNKRNIDSQKSYHVQECKEIGTSIPTRIVVLKPNLGKVQSTSRCSLSPCSHVLLPDVDFHNECSSIMHDGSEMRYNCNARCKFDNNACRSQESRELAREITQRMRDTLGVDSFNISSFGHYGYSADESGHDMSENDSSYDSEVIKSQTSSERSIDNKASTSRYNESSVNMEAKRRLSERWKKIRRSHLIGAYDNGSTLAEMLAIPDVDISPHSSNAIIAQDKCAQIVRSHARASQPVGPLGISSRDGWKDGCVKNLSRSRSLPASSNHLRSSESSKRHEAQAVEKFLAHKESVGKMNNNLMKKGSGRKEIPLSGSPVSNNRRSKHYYTASMDIFSDALEIQSHRGMMTKNLDENDSFEVKGVSTGMPSCRQHAISALHSVADIENRDVESESCPGQQIPASETPIRVELQDSTASCDSSSLGQEPSTISQVSGSYCLRHAATQQESPLSSKESEQPSPVSVLEPPFVEELSSGSECFERVSAGLHGLRMQLQLLKLGSETYDGVMLMTSDEDADLSGKLHCEGLLQVCESWESSYLLDVLTESKLGRTDPEFFLSTWHSSDCPISSWVFEDLEKKYSDYESCLRSERRLLFDRINSKIIEISQQYLNPYPWVKQPRKIVAALRWKDGWFETELQKLLDICESQMTDDAMVVIPDCLPQLELEVHVDFIGKYIEGLLMDELVEELLPL